MRDKTIAIYERYDGVRFVLERSLSCYQDDVNIISSYQKTEIKHLIKENHVDLLITELSKNKPDGLEISHYARKVSPNLQIIWITVLGCDIFRSERERIGEVLCVEKPLEINEFRRTVLNILSNTK